LQDILEISDQTALDLNRQNLDIGIIVPWHVKTKYYETDLAFWLLQADTLPQSETASFTMQEWETISSAIDAFVLIISKPEDLSLVNQWNHLLETNEPSIKICLVDSDNPSSLDALQSICLEHMFELINLRESSTEETAGLSRLIEALQSHEWPATESHEVRDAFNQLFSNLDSEDGFDDAVSKLQCFKTQAEQKDPEQRRQLAETVALAFERFISESTGPTAEP
jgi:hypothetical protein